VTIPGIARYGDGMQSGATRQPLPPMPTARVQAPKHSKQKGL